MEKDGRVAFIAGLLGISIAIVSAQMNPATGYELSIYAATPLAFWVGVAGTAVAGIAGGVFPPTRQERLVSVVFSIIAVALVLLLPLLRGYYFYGQGDALAHLAWTNDLMAGRDIFHDLLYPGFHTFAAIVAQVLSIPSRLALMGIMPAFYLLFVLSLPLLAREFYPSQSSLLIPLAILFGLLTTPIISIRLPNIQPLPTVAGLFLVPVVAWLGIHTDRAQKSQRRPLFIALLVMLTALIFYHPQQALSAVMLLGVYLIIPLRSVSTESGRPSPSPLLTSLLISGGVLMYWLSSKVGFGGVLLKLISGFQSVGGGAVAVPSTSFQEVGGSILGLFIRALLIPSVIGLATVVVGVTAIWRIYRRSTRDRDDARRPQIADKRLLRYLFGIVPVLFLGAVTFVAADLAQSLRYFALAVALGTPVAALLLWQILDWSDGRKATVAVVLLLLVGGAVAMPTALRSPFVYQATPQVTEAQLMGYDWTFDNRANAPVAAVDTGVKRHLRLAQNPSQQSQGQDVVAELGGGRAPGYAPAHFANHNLTGTGSQTWMLVSTDFAKSQHTKLYDGIIFSQRDFAYLDRTPGISVVYTNGDTEVRKVSHSQPANR
jgi:heme/copper-type cytochrome/quinol oxidase subunit 2